VKLPVLGNVMLWVAPEPEIPVGPAGDTDQLYPDAPPDAVNVTVRPTPTLAVEGETVIVCGCPLTLKLDTAVLEAAYVPSDSFSTVTVCGPADVNVIV